MMSQDKISVNDNRGSFPKRVIGSPFLRYLLIFCLLTTALPYFGCAKRIQAFRHPEADLSAITRVAVIPFENLTSSQFAGEKVTAIYISELLMNVDIEIVEPGELIKALIAQNIVGTKLSLSEIKSVGRAVKADSLIFGSVQEYGQQRIRNENYPVVSLNVRWVDVNTGTIIFMGTAAEEGSPKVPIVDWGEERLFSVLTRKVCRKLIKLVR
jgi:hypothetical protein